MKKKAYNLLLDSNITWLLTIVFRNSEFLNAFRKCKHCEAKQIARLRSEVRKQENHKQDHNGPTTDIDSQVPTSEPD